jgi:glycerophosphoryl diester phosphodiesterase
MESPENTLQAFLNGSKHAQMLETDVRITKDGVILVCHDADFYRLCLDEGLVKDTHSKELPIFRDRLPMHFSKGQYYHLKPTDQ